MIRIHLITWCVDDASCQADSVGGVGETLKSRKAFSCDGFNRFSKWIWIKMLNKNFKDEISVLPLVRRHPEDCCPVQQSETPQSHSSSPSCVRMRNGERRSGRPWRWHRRRQTRLSAHTPSRKETNAHVYQTVNYFFWTCNDTDINILRQQKRFFETSYNTWHLT